MHVRSNNHTVQFFRGWLLRLVEGYIMITIIINIIIIIIIIIYLANVMNDQREINFEKENNSIRINNCYVDYNFTNEYNNRFKYCFLNEFIFQNGLMEFYCSKGNNIIINILI